MQVRVEGPTSVIGHQNFHLSFGKILDVLVEGARFRSLHIHRCACLFVRFISKEFPALHGHVAARDAMLGRGPQKVTSRLLVTRP